MKKNNRNKQKEGEVEPILPPFLEIPLDEEDYRFTQSFEVGKSRTTEASDFFETYGFIIFRDVISREECHEILTDMIDLLQEINPEIDRENPETWATGLTRFGLPKGVHSLFRPSLLRLRQNPSVFESFASTLKTDDLIVSHDRWLLHRPPPRDAKGKVQPLTKGNLHLDMNPWEYSDPKEKNAVMKRLDSLSYGTANGRAFIAENNDVHKSMGTCIQGIVNLCDIVGRQNGGTIVVPGSHKTFDSWIQSRNAKVSKRRVGPMQYVLDDGDPMNNLTYHPTLRAGSMIIWDQRLFHGSTPNLSRDIRAGVPVRAFPTSVLQKSQRRMADRWNTIRREMVRIGFDSEEITELGEKLFGHLR